MSSSWQSVWEIAWRSTFLLSFILIAVRLCRPWLLVRQTILQVGLVGLLLLPLTVAFPKITWTVLPPIQVVARPQASAANDIDVRQVSTENVAAVPSVQSTPVASTKVMSVRTGSSVKMDPLEDHAAVRKASAGTRLRPAMAPQHPPVTSASDSSSHQLRESRFRWIPTLQSIESWGVVYALGVVLMIGRLLLGYLHLRNLRKDSAVCRDEVWQAELQACQQKLGINYEIEFRASEILTTPLTYGYWRPVLVVPIPMLESATGAERHAVLLHELTHIQRHDFAWRLTVHGVQALYWLHPLAWWFGRAFSETQEEVCDAICAAEFGTQSYAEMLINVVRSVRRSPAMALGLAMSRTSRLSRRLTRIQRQGGLSVSRMSGRNLCFVAGLTIPVVVASLLIQPVRAQSPAIDSPAAKPKQKSSATLQSPVGFEQQEDSNNPLSGIQFSQPLGFRTASAEIRNLELKLAKARQDARAQEGLAAYQVKLPAAEEPRPAVPYVLVQVQSSKDKPLALTPLKVRRYLPGDGFPKLADGVIEVTTDSAGLVSIPLEGVAADVKSLDLEIHAADHAPAGDDFAIRRTTDTSKPQTVLMRPSIHLSTRAFGPDGLPVADAQVTVLADIPDSNFDTWKLYCRSSADGRIELDVPRDAVFGFKVVSERGAPYRVVYPAGTQKITDVYLQRGCVVSGQLLDREGKPVPKCSIMLEGEDSQAVSTELEVKRHGGGALELAFLRRTDDQGRFKFPPMTGDVRIYLECNDPAKVPGTIVPVNVNLPAGSEKWVPLMLAPTGTISGTIRWADGKPASKVRLELEVPPNKSNSYISLCGTRTDENGHYSLLVPYPLEEAWISPSGLSGTNGKYFEPKPVGAPANGRQARMKHVVQYLGEPLTVDWVMTPEESGRQSPAGETVEAQPSDVRDPLAQLEHDILAAYKAVREAKTREEKERAYPRQALMERCLELEAQQRGTRVAIGALHFVMRSAAATLEKEATDARTRAMQILDQHYLKHADVDLLLDSIEAGSTSAAAEPLLNHLIEQSPFDYVRAKALSELVDLKRDFLNFGEMVMASPARPIAEEEAMIKIQSTEDAREFLKRGFEQQRRTRELMAKTNVVELRRSIVETLDRIISQYSGVVTPRRRWQNASGESADVELHLVDWTEPETWRIRTIAEWAAIQRFQFTRLQVGMVAPEIEGADLHLQPIRLSQYRGKVVLLTASLGNVENELYAECAQLVKKFGDQPFACVSVIPGAGNGGYSIRAIVEDGKVTWPIIRDNHEDDISHNWCQQTFPIVYLIDQQGVIRHFDAGSYASNGLEAKIEKLLKP